MDWTIELMVVPVSDVDRAKAFYADKMSFNVDVDYSPNEDFRVVQLTPKGSACSITLMKNMTPGTQMEPGSLRGIHLIVPDIEAARAELVGRGVEIGEPFHFGEAGQTPGLDPDRRNYGTFATFNDPDGNTWLLQEVNRARVEENEERAEARAEA